jgi:hypothetical protein
MSNKTKSAADADPDTFRSSRNRRYARNVPDAGLYRCSMGRMSLPAQKEKA